MSFFAAITGIHRGRNQLWLEGDRKPVEESEATYTVTSDTIVWTWSREGDVMEGRLSISGPPDAIVGTFQDTFHQETPAKVTGTLEGDTIRLEYAYHAEPPPAWRWRIEVDVSDFELRMTNLVPSLEGRPPVDEPAVRFRPASATVPS